MTALSESKSDQKCRSYYRAYLFLIGIFLRELIGFSRLPQILDALSDSSELLHLTRGHIALLNSVVRIKIGTKM